jgi:hypothetical protein
MQSKKALKTCPLWHVEHLFARRRSRRRSQPAAAEGHFVTRSKAVYAEEAILAKQRLEERKPILGAERLRQQPYLRSHTPKKKERRIFIICGDDRLRPQIIAAHQDISNRHRRCYQLLKDGLPHEWPPGTFIPWVPPKQCRPAYQPSIC